MCPELHRFDRMRFVPPAGRKLRCLLASDNQFQAQKTTDRPTGPRAPGHRFRAWTTPDRPAGPRAHGPTSPKPPIPGLDEHRPV